MDKLIGFLILLLILCVDAISVMIIGNFVLTKVAINPVEISFETALLSVVILDYWQIIKKSLTESYNELQEYNSLPK